jgi:HrpA-like RNA helicase
MARQWTTKCLDPHCPETIGYADEIARRAAALGERRVGLCAKHQRTLQHELRAVPIASADLEWISSAPDRLDAPPLGSLPTVEPVHSREQNPGRVAEEVDRGKFGVRDREILDLYEELSRTDTPVIVAVAPTGSGKSTYLPFRLLCALGGSDFAVHGQIVVTQPRRAPAEGIPKYVSGDLYGAHWGKGYVIGYRHSGDRACDWRNEMIYVTDGTLINWLIRGDLDKIGLIMLDEAHERSLNIDIILGLLTQLVPRYPYLKIVIASATIDHEKFRRYFDTHLPAGMRCAVVSCSGSKQFGLRTHYRKTKPLEYHAGTVRNFSEEVSNEVANATTTLLRRMFHGPTADGLNGGPSITAGDIIAFLHGAKPIDDAVAQIAAAVESDPDMRGQVDVYPLHASVDRATMDKALSPKKDPARRRVFVATNAAETSLTIDGIVHVVESGIIKMTRWDPLLEQAPLVPVVHSRAGCRQRWGRAGRKEQGFAWCLYTQDQFDDPGVFRPETLPEIQRSKLDKVVLDAKCAGADRLDGGHFPWLDPPADEEIGRSVRRLTRQGALHPASGDLTEIGHEMRFAEVSPLASFIALADRFGFGVEAATLAPVIENGVRHLFVPRDNASDRDVRARVERRQDEARARCADDLELALRIYSEWCAAETGGAPLTTEPTWDHNWRAALDAWKPARDGRLAATVRTAALGISTLRELDDLKAPAGVAAGTFEEWRHALRASFRRVAAQVWALLNGIDDEFLRTTVEKRTDHIRALGAKKKGIEDRAINFAGMPRLRILIARCFPDRLYVPIDPGADGSTDTSPDGRFCQLSVAPDEAPHELVIPRYSAAWARDLTAFVACGPRNERRNERQQTLGERRTSRVVDAAFVVSVDRDLAVEIIEADDLTLAQLFAKRFPRPIEMTDDNLAMNEEVNLHYPPGTWVEAQIVDEDEPGSYLVKLLRPLRMSVPSPPVQTRRTYNERDDARERDFDFRFPDANAAAAKPRHTLEVERDGLEVDLIAETVEGSAADDGDPSAAPNPADMSALRAGHSSAVPLHGVLRLAKADRAPAAGAVIEAEVVSVSRDPEGSRPPLIHLTDMSSAERFRAFVDSHPAGTSVRMRVPERAERGDGLLVRHEASGYEMLVRAEDVIPSGRALFLALIPDGTELTFDIRKVDRTAHIIELDALSTCEPVLDELATARDETHEARVVAIEESDDRLFAHLMLAASRPEDGVILAAKIIIRRADVSTDGLPFRENDKISVTLKFGGAHFNSRTAIGPEATAALSKASIGIAGTHAWRAGRMPLVDRVALLNQLRDAASADVIRGIFLRSNEPVAEFREHELAQRYPVGKTVEAKVQGFGRGGVNVLVDGVVRGTIPSAEVTWHREKRPRSQRELLEFVQPGQVVKATVTNVVVEHHVLKLSIRAGTNDPWDDEIPNKYKKGTAVEGEIENLNPQLGLFVKLELGVKGLVWIRKLPPHMTADPDRFFPRGRLARVIVEDVAPQEQKVSLKLQSTEQELLCSPIVGSAAPPGSAAEDGEEEQPLDEDDANAWPWDDGHDALPKDASRSVAPDRHAPRASALPNRLAPGFWQLDPLSSVRRLWWDRLLDWVVHQYDRVRR